MPDDTEKYNNKIQKYTERLSHYLSHNNILINCGISHNFWFDDPGYYNRGNINVSRFYLNPDYIQCFNIYSFVHLKEEFRKEWILNNCPKYKKSEHLFFTDYKGKYTPLDYKTEEVDGKKIIIPIIPSKIYEDEKQKRDKIKAKEKENKILKLERELNISSFSGKMLLEGVTSEITIVNNILFVHNFGESFLRINIFEEKYILGVSRHHSRKEYMKIGEYTEEECLLHISNLFKIGMLK